MRTLTRRAFVVGGAGLFLAGCMSGQAASNDARQDGGDVEATDASKEAAGVPQNERRKGPEETTDPTTEGEDTMGTAIIVTVDGTTFPAHLAHTEAAAAFAERLPLTLDMSELNGNEKYCYLDKSLPASAEGVGHVDAGDLMLFGADCVVLFYESFDTGYSYTRLGALDDPSDLADTVGSGGATVTFEL